MNKIKKKNNYFKKGGQEEEEQDIIMQIEDNTSCSMQLSTEKKTQTSKRRTSISNIPLEPIKENKKEEQENITFPSSLPQELRDKYIPIRILGRGSYGQVWEAAIRTTPSIHVAIKLSLSVYDPEEGIPIDILNEISLLKRINHPNIIKLVEVYIIPQTNKKEQKYEEEEEEPTPNFAFVLELGKYNLNHLIKKIWFTSEGLLERAFKQIPFQIQVAYEIFCGINYLHENGIWHLDLKPENIIISQDNHVKIADFGISVREEKLKDPGYTKITRIYRAPEVECGNRFYNAKADIWSIGIILIELFFNKNLVIPLKRKPNTFLWYNIKQKVGLPSQKWLDKYYCQADICPISSEEKKEIKENKDSYNTELDKTVLNNNIELIKRYSQMYYKLDIYTQIWDLISKCLRIDPEERITFEQVKKHPLFTRFRTCETCTECLEVETSYHIPLEHSSITFHPALEKLLKPSKYALQEVQQIYILLIEYSKEIFTRFIRFKPDRKTDYKIQAASILIALKLLLDDYLFNFRTNIMRELHLSQDQLNEAEIEVGNTLNWNFDGEFISS